MDTLVSAIPISEFRFNLRYGDHLKYVDHDGALWLIYKDRAVLDLNAGEHPTDLYNSII